LTVIAAMADGSFRDGTKLLEQAIAEGIHTEEGIRTMIGASGQDVDRFLIFLFEKKTNELLSNLLTMEQNGQDIKFFVTHLLNRLHGLLVSKYGIGTAPKTEILKNAPPMTLTSCIKLFSRVFVEMKTASSPTLPLEVAVVEWCEGNK